MVYDLGAATSTCPLLEIGDGVIEVLATAGNNRLGATTSTSASWTGSPRSSAAPRASI
jgi:molecular chaperone DnaK (HSP70)